MAPTPILEPEWPVPQLSLRIDDLAHPPASIFLEAVDPLTALREAVIASFTWLYTPETAPKNVETLVLILRPMPGVAHATGGTHHKEIHFSLDYIAKSANRARDEIRGVLTHEIVHCFQYDAEESCPGGLIEGIADYVRLRAGFAPPHWTQRGGDEWDAGYETTGYFLAWLEGKYGEGTIRKLNGHMNGVPYDKGIFKQCTGMSVKKLWIMYCAHLEDKA
ncbi:plant basic secretory protein [Lyophyllum atratum]|nr:plant basic secretory protein [Lyophyllum atratum]